MNPLPCTRTRTLEARQACNLRNTHLCMRLYAPCQQVIHTEGCIRPWRLLAHERKHLRPVVQLHGGIACICKQLTVLTEVVNCLLSLQYTAHAQHGLGYDRQVVLQRTCLGRRPMMGACASLFTKHRAQGTSRSTPRHANTQTHHAALQTR